MHNHTETNNRGSRSGFVAGLAVGLLGALALVAVNDLSLRVLPAPGSARAEAAPAVAEAGRFLFAGGALPEGVAARVDGRTVEVEPCAGGFRIPWPEGSTRIAFTNDQGVLWTATHPGADPPDTLRPTLGGEIVVEVERQGPAGDVLLDGRVVGTAPAVVAAVPPGWHVVSLVASGRVLYEDECHVRPGEVTSVRVPPAPPWGRGGILVRSRRPGEAGMEPSAGEAVWVDGVPVGSTPVDHPATAGYHSVRVERIGFMPHVETVYVAAGASRDLIASFGGDERLDVEVAVSGGLRRGTPAAIPVRISALGAPIALADGTVHLIRAGREETVAIPLVASGTNPHLWAAILPGELVTGVGELRGYVECRDDEGRAGASEIFAFDVR